MKLEDDEIKELTLKIEQIEITTNRVDEDAERFKLLEEKVNESEVRISKRSRK